MNRPSEPDAQSEPSGRAPPRVIKVLMLEDLPSDAELAERALKAAGLAVSVERVDSEPAFIAALDQFAPDVVLVDFKLPSYDGLSAVKYLHTHYPDLPAIVVTGALGDETAVELIKAGAMDFILKDRMARLGAAVQHAISEAEKSAQLRKQDAAIRTAEKNLYAIATYSQDAIIMMNERMIITFWNKSAEACFGYTAEEAVGRDLYSFLAHKSEADVIHRQIDSFLRAGREHVTGWTHTLRIKKRDGTVSPLDLSISFIRLEGQWNVVGVVRPQSIQF